MTDTRQLLLWTVLCVFSGLQLVACANFDCTYKGDLGYYDLTPLTAQILGNDAGNTWNYYIQMCGTAAGAGTYASFCGPKGAMVCQTYISSPTGNTYAIAYPDDRSSAHMYSEISNGIQLVAYGESCSTKNYRTANIQITCDKTITGPITSLTSAVTEVSSTCVYTIKISHSAGCASATPPASGDSGSSSSSISGGSVFLIIFFVGAFVYVAGGCFYKRYRKGTTGMIESCPNNEFWTAVPGLVKDGGLYTVRKVKSLCSGGSGGSTSGGTGSYETI